MSCPRMPRKTTGGFGLDQPRSTSPHPLPQKVMGQGKGRSECLGMGQEFHSLAVVPEREECRSEQRSQMLKAKGPIDPEPLSPTPTPSKRARSLYALVIHTKGVCSPQT